MDLPGQPGDQQLVSGSCRLGELALAMGAVARGKRDPDHYRAVLCHPVNPKVARLPTTCAVTRVRSTSSHPRASRRLRARLFLLGEYTFQWTLTPLLCQAHHGSPLIGPSILIYSAPK